MHSEEAGGSRDEAEDMSEALEQEQQAAALNADSVNKGTDGGISGLCRPAREKKAVEM